MGLSDLGAGKYEAAAENFAQCLEIDYNHQKCRWYLEKCRK